MKTFSMICLVLLAGSVVAQEKDSATFISTIDCSLIDNKIKEGLFRGLVHEGPSVGIEIANRSQAPSYLHDWSMGMNAGVALWNGAMTASITVYPLDEGYAIRYGSPLLPFTMFVGPYARLEMTWNAMLQLDAQHPYWFTQHQLGVRNWLLWNVAEEKTLMLKTDLSVFSLVSRPPLWRDYATYTLNFLEILKYMNKGLEFATLADALRLQFRLEYIVRFGGEIPILYFLDVTYRYASDPKPYHDFKESFGFSIPLHQQ